METFVRYLEEAVGVDEVLRITKLRCQHLSYYASYPSRLLRRKLRCSQDPASGLVEVNARFRNASVGYQYEGGKIVRVDSQYVHAEVVQPAVRLIGTPEFAGAEKEFRMVHEHFRHGNWRDCNTAALRCIETILKIICDARGWDYNQDATVEKLMAIVRAKGVFPDYLGGYFDNLIGPMKAGLPKIRDKDGGHGAGPNEAAVPDDVAMFALNLAASNVLLLVHAHQNLGRLNGPVVAQ